MFAELFLYIKTESIVATNGRQMLGFRDQPSALLPFAQQRQRNHDIGGREQDQRSSSSSSSSSSRRLSCKFLLPLSCVHPFCRCYCWCFCPDVRSSSSTFGTRAHICCNCFSSRPAFPLLIFLTFANDFSSYTSFEVVLSEQKETEIERKEMVNQCRSLAKQKGPARGAQLWLSFHGD